MKADGVVAVNFAGKLTGKPSRATLAMLKKSFKTCRAFHDSTPEVSEKQMETEFLNIVFFCTPSLEPPTFREPIERDYHHSYLREHVFTTLYHIWPHAVRWLYDKISAASEQQLSLPAREDVMARDFPPVIALWQNLLED
ncbi:hypothetical protein NEOLEDRAFT_583698 [Neolentinus lepideus HHB14362 ss-1]|uniref:Uncharacterized protein n=1 Tax=Neolentinus lepideus HHB14362 ss-1 TaxID=1314782 RepID=A0A165V6M6_9AGAM|nr:hypothetical protein NEOLEDRAFT_583698 [Neolentinus lepideus HHB14362 ss-1]